VVGEYCDEDSCSSSCSAAVVAVAAVVLAVAVAAVAVVVVAVAAVVVVAVVAAVDVAAATPLGVDLWVEVEPQYPPAPEPVVGSLLAQEAPDVEASID
jgi:hypothetical protein